MNASYIAQEAAVLAQIRARRGFSVFWATETAARAKAIDRLQKRGVIAPRPGKSYGSYPWCGYLIRKRNQYWYSIIEC